jgi:hypothetical protein
MDTKKLLIDCAVYNQPWWNETPVLTSTTHATILLILRLRPEAAAGGRHFEQTAAGGRHFKQVALFELLHANLNYWKIIANFKLFYILNNCEIILYANLNLHSCHANSFLSDTYFRLC